MFLSVFTTASIVIDGFTPREIGLPVTSFNVCRRRELYISKGRLSDVSFFFIFNVIITVKCVRKKCV